MYVREFALCLWYVTDIFSRLTFVFVFTYGVVLFLFFAMKLFCFTWTNRKVFLTPGYKEINSCFLLVHLSVNSILKNFFYYENFWACKYIESSVIDSVYSSTSFNKYHYMAYLISFTLPSTLLSHIIIIIFLPYYFEANLRSYIISSLNISACKWSFKNFMFVPGLCNVISFIYCLILT